MIEILNAEISIIGILLATVLSVVVGMLWFGPIMGNEWMKEIGKKKEELVAKPTDYVANILSAFVTAFILSHLVFYARTTSVLGEFAEDGILMGEWSDVVTGIVVPILAWIAFTIPALMNRVIWEGSSQKLFLINAGHMFFNFLVMGVTVSLFMFD